MYYTIKIDMKCNYLNFNVFLDVLKYDFSALLHNCMVCSLWNTLYESMIFFYILLRYKVHYKCFTQG